MEGLLELDRIGKLIAGKYRLELVLGRGGMGTVYRATHTWTGRPVAVKYLHPEHAQDTASVGRFLREARAAASVRHPNAVDVLDMGQDSDGSAYLVLELLEGGTLGQYLAANGRMDPPDAARILVPVIEALDELHRAGVVHRDFKPANIFLASGPRGAVTPKLLDFGVAKVLDENAGLSTTTGIVVGTPAYMAPEQAAGNGEVGPWTDIWAAGAVLYECLVGELPFPAPTPSLMLVEVMTKSARPLSEKRPDVSAAVCQVVDRALSKDPRRRFESAAAMADALREAAGLTQAVGALSGPLALSGAAPTSTPATAESGVQFAAHEAPTIAVTPNAMRAAGTPPTPKAEAVGGDAADRSQWTGPNATGRLQGPGRSRRRAVLAGVAVALGLVGVALWSQSPQAPESTGHPVAQEAKPAAAAVVDGAAVSNGAEGLAAPGPEPQKPALAVQPDAGIAERKQTAEVPPARFVGTAGQQTKPTLRSRRAADEKRAQERPRSSQATATAPAKETAPVAEATKPTKADKSAETKASGSSKTDSVGPPGLVREW